MRTPTAQLAATPASLRTIGTALEACWLLAAGLVPVAMVHETLMAGYIQMPKVLLVRTVALLIAGLLVAEWAVKGRAGGAPKPTARSSRGQAAARGPTGVTAAARRLAAVPGFWVHAGAAAVLAANGLALIFSPAPRVSLLGPDPGWDGYSFHSIASYLVIFLGVATHLRREEQVRRLVWVIAGAATWVSAYGFLQHFGVDILHPSSSNAVRSELTFGNPIFGGSWLVMAIPVTLSAMLAYGDRLGRIERLYLSAGGIALPMTALVFTLSRGPWAGAGAGAMVLFVLLWWTHGKEMALRAGAALVVAVALALALAWVPTPRGPARVQETVGGRIFSSAPEVVGGFQNRITIWRTAADIYVRRPWVDTERYPEIPELRVRGLRPLVGFGQDMFGYVYPLAGETTYTTELASHGHNYLVHAALELGALGVAAYLALGGAVGVLGLRLVRAARAARMSGSGQPLLVGLVSVGLASALVGRAVEQIPGKAQVADHTLAWVLTGLVVGLVAMRTSAVPPSVPVPLAAGRRPRQAPAANTAGTTTAGQGPALWRVAVLGVVTIGLTVFWTLADVPQVLAANRATDAEDALKQGDLATAVTIFQEAIDFAPYAPLYHIRRSEALGQLAARAPDAGRRATIMDSAVQEAQKAVAWNPFDQRAWSRAAEYAREAAIARQAGKDAAIHQAQVLAALMPGFWQAHAVLGWSYTQLREPDKGLQELDLALRYVGDGPSGFFVEFFRAVTLEALGRRGEAMAAAQRSLELRRTNEALTLLARLTAATPSG